MSRLQHSVTRFTGFRQEKVFDPETPKESQSIEFLLFCNKLKFIFVLF